MSRETPRLEFRPMSGAHVVVHGHCHQKAFGVMPKLLDTLRLVPGIEPRVIESGCCGMAGSFGYEAEHYELSMKMAEAALLPAIRRLPASAVVIAPGTSCRHQIDDGVGITPLHPARFLRDALQQGAT
jgi:Fe-S oxidoreductase